MTPVCFGSFSLCCVKNVPLDGGGLGVFGNFIGLCCLVVKNGFSVLTDVRSLTFEGRISCLALLYCFYRLYNTKLIQKR